MKIRLPIVVFTVALLALPSLLFAQGLPSFTGHYVPGVEGIKGSSLPPPGFYVRDYNVFYFASQLNDPTGAKVPLDFDAFVYANLLRGIWITDWKLLGGNVGMDMIVPFVNTSLSVKSGTDTLYNQSIFGIGDLYFEPLTLSWHGKQYDAAFGYSFFAPTACSSPGTAKPGKGFWTHLITLGATVYFDEEKTWSLSALNRYEFNTEERDTHITPGQVWTVEWGLSKSVTKTVEIGLVGYYQLQTTTDSGAGASGARDQVVGVGPEIVAFCPKLGLFTSVRYLREFAAQDRPEGNTVTLTLTRRF
jgi:hypothetical protein